MTQVTHSEEHNLGYAGTREEISRYFTEVFPLEKDPSDAFMAVMNGALYQAIHGDTEDQYTGTSLCNIFAAKAACPALEKRLAPAHGQLYHTFSLLLESGKPEVIEKILETVPAAERLSYLEKAHEVAEHSNTTRHFAPRFARKLAG